MKIVALKMNQEDTCYNPGKMHFQAKCQYNLIRVKVGDSVRIIISE
jgi:hypothetical protein